jgi:uncharacterized membrane protein
LDLKKYKLDLIGLGIEGQGRGYIDCCQLYFLLQCLQLKQQFPSFHTLALALTYAQLTLLSFIAHCAIGVETLNFEINFLVLFPKHLFALCACWGLNC